MVRTLCRVLQATQRKTATMIAVTTTNRRNANACGVTAPSPDRCSCSGGGQPAMSRAVQCQIRELSVMCCDFCHRPGSFDGLLEQSEKDTSTGTWLEISPSVRQRS